MKQNLLLITDVDDLGRSGEIVSVNAGYARNYLLPQKMAIIATKNTLRKQKLLQEERAKKAAVDKKDSEELAKVLAGVSLETFVKVDPEGKMYGSVSSQDIVTLLSEQKGISLEKKSVQLKHAIKDIGSYSVSFKLKEGVIGNCKLEIIPEGGKLPIKEEKEPKKEEETEAIEEKEEENKKE